jgi:hypothetical protein
MRDLHAALKTFILKEFQEGGIHYKAVRLQYGKDDFLDSLHACPSSYSTAGLQTTDLLHFLGFERSPCAFYNGECYVKEIPSNLDVLEFANSIRRAYDLILDGSRHLEKCGIFINQPEGWGFFSHRPSSNRIHPVYHPTGNGHVAPESQRIKSLEDEYFYFVFTWISDQQDKGWTIHYRAKHMPLSPEFSAALKFIGGFSTFGECPEFDFNPCWWRFMPFKDDEKDWGFDNAEHAYRQFDSHTQHFSPGLKQLLAAHAELQKHGISFLPITKPVKVITSDLAKKEEAVRTGEKPKSRFRYDVAISYASTEKELAEKLAKHLRESGFEVFYDDFYPEQLWGKDLASFFDQIYRKDSKFCVMFISEQYAKRMWTTFERKCAQARAIEEKGTEYILPVRIDDTDLDGLPSTIGFLSLDKYSIEQIAELLIKKLRA